MNRTRLVVASSNPAKLREIEEIIAPLVYEAVAIGRLVPDFDVEETESTFEGNARLKAQAAAKATGLIAIADDSGLQVDALGGAPGIYSARYAATDAERVARLLKELAGVTERSACFVCALAVCRPGGECVTARGRVEGHICEAPRGRGGFGYDPVFVPAGKQRTFAELTAAEKHALSHRGRALAQLPELLSKLATRD